MSDLEEGIQITEEAVDATPKDHPNRVSLLNDLGTRLGETYSATGAIYDLEQAISCQQKALRQCSSFALTRIRDGTKVLPSLCRDPRLAASLPQN